MKGLLATAIESYCEAEGIGTREFSQRVGIGYVALYDIAGGQVLPSMPTLRAFSRVIQWSPAELGAVILALPDETTPRLSVNSSEQPARERFVALSRGQPPLVQTDAGAVEHQRTDTLGALSRGGDQLDTAAEASGKLFRVDGGGAGRGGDVGASIETPTAQEEACK